MKNKVFILILILLLATCLFACEDKEPVQGIVVDKYEKQAWMQPVVMSTHTVFIYHPHKYILHINMNGRLVNIAVKRDVYETYNVGDYYSEEG